MTGRCTGRERRLPGSGGRLKMLNWNLHSFKLLEVIQVLDSISWVRCASGNVFTYIVGSKELHKVSFLNLISMKLKM